MLRRHQLARLSDAGWQRLQTMPWDSQARECVDYWAAHRLPLVVTRQPAEGRRLALGLPAPQRFGRRRLAIEVVLDDVLYFDAFPPSKSIAAMLARPLRSPWLDLCGALADLGCAARVYGSHGWQSLTGVRYVHSESDLDVLMPVDAMAMADAVCAALAASPIHAPRLDGELVFPDGAGVAWREWLQWRNGNTRRLLVKRIDGVALEDGPICEPLPC